MEPSKFEIGHFSSGPVVRPATRWSNGPLYDSPEAAAGDMAIAQAKFDTEAQRKRDSIDMHRQNAACGNGKYLCVSKLTTVKRGPDETFCHQFSPCCISLSIPTGGWVGYDANGNRFSSGHNSPLFDTRDQAQDWANKKNAHLSAESFALDETQQNCNHAWGVISHEEGRCEICGATRFVYDC